MSFKKSLKGFYFILSVTVISLMHLPFAFAKTNSINRMSSHPVISSASVTDWADPFFTTSSATSSKSIYDSLHLDDFGLNRQAFEYAKNGWEKLVDQGRIQKSIMAIADFSQPSNHKRLYVLDMKNYKVLYNTLVSHGKNSGREWASSFSNQPSSFKSSPGFYITGDTYNGGNGFSLRLDGIEQGINDNAFERAIVMHGADYVSESFARSKGYIGRSHGCPAVPLPVAKPIINTLKNGACLFVYAATAQYSSRSSLIS